MKITALDIYNQEFKKSFRGYDRDEVDSFLESAARSFEELTKQNQALSQQIKVLEDGLEEHRRKEQSIYEALLGIFQNSQIRS